MPRIFQQTVLWRLLTLGVLILCLNAILRYGSDAQVPSPRQLPPVAAQTLTPIIRARILPGTPLVISSARLISADPQSGEIAFNLTNVSEKPIRAFAIQQEVEAGGAQQTSISLHNLELTGSELQPGQSIGEFDTYQVLSEKVHRITLAVDYVEFSDGTKWGPDSIKSSERTAGERAAANMLSKRLINIIGASNPSDVMTVIEAEAANIKPPIDRSDEWNEGFRLGRISLANRLRRAQNKGGLPQVEYELRQLAERFKGVQ